MIVDDELFFARRLGYGLRRGEVLGGNVRDWAIRQISEIPPLDFYGRDGSSIRSRFPDFAEPVTSVAEGTRQWGEYADLELTLEAKVSEMPSDEWQRMMDEKIYLPRTDYPMWRDCLIRSLTAVNGPSPVFERFWSFWVNHFTVNANSFTKLMYGPHTRVIRAAMTGKFGDLLQEAVLNPAMLYYLDNWLSTGPNSPTGRNSNETINENLARELLELHTMSPAGGYTQDDVIQTAYALSGWSFFGGRLDQKDIPKKSPFGTYFNPNRHEPGARKIMGKTYAKGKNKGIGQAPELIADLAIHPETAHFISMKLLRHFLADEPPQDSTARVAQVWLDTGGDLVAVHTAVIDEVLEKARDYEKFTTPDVWLFQTHRTASVDIPETVVYDYSDDHEYWITAVCEELGQSFNECPQPLGWSDLRADWISKELLERRVRYAYQVALRIPDEPSHEYIREIATRLAGPESELLAAIDAAGDPRAASLLLFTSPEFMRI